MAARYTLIKGSFAVIGTEPDGDTIRFQPDDPSIVSGLGPAGQRPAFSHGGAQINVRFEGIDALETHFQNARQQVRLGDLATQTMLKTLGFSSVMNAGLKVTAATPPLLRGHVLANSLDSFGRMIAFVYAGEAPGADGAPTFLDLPKLGLSVNAQLLAQGVVYPAFYTTLPIDLKNTLSAQARLVREQAIGLWPEDAPSLDRAADVPNLDAAEALVMWPKLFRRLVSYFQAGNAGLDGFYAWLREDKRNRDDYLLLPDGELGNMHDLVAITGNSMRLRYRPEDIVVLPDSFVEQPQPQPQPDPVPGPTPNPGPGPVPRPGLIPVRLIAALVNPLGDDAGQETVTLLNVSAATINLAGWQIRDRQLQSANEPGLALVGMLGAGEAMRVPLRAPVLLGNQGDDIVLVDPAGAVAQTATYTRGQGSRQGVTVLL